ncbi:hypothetical protein ACEQPO_28765 [Bacillus sp. SL00103]
MEVWVTQQTTDYDEGPFIHAGIEKETLVNWTKSQHSMHTLMEKRNLKAY